MEIALLNPQPSHAKIKEKLSSVLSQLKLPVGKAVFADKNIDPTQNCILLAETGSGKSILFPVLARLFTGKTVVIRQPTRAACGGNYEGLKKFWGDLLTIGIRTSRMKDTDSLKGENEDEVPDILVVSDGNLKNIVTRFDNLVIIFDEFHWEVKDVTETEVALTKMAMKQERKDLGIIKNAIQRGKNLQIMFLSATIRPDRLIEYWEDLNPNPVSKNEIDKIISILDTDSPEKINNMEQNQFLKLYYASGRTFPIEKKLTRDDNDVAIMKFIFKMYKENKSGLVFVAAALGIDKRAKSFSIIRKSSLEKAGVDISGVDFECKCGIEDKHIHVFTDFFHANAPKSAQELAKEVEEKVKKYEHIVIFSTSAISTSVTISFHEVLIIDEAMDSENRDGIVINHSGVVMDNNQKIQSGGRVGRKELLDKEGNLIPAVAILNSTQKKAPVSKWWERISINERRKILKKSNVPESYSSKKFYEIKSEWDRNDIEKSYLEPYLDNEWYGLDYDYKNDLIKRAGLSRVGIDATTPWDDLDEHKEKFLLRKIYNIDNKYEVKSWDEIKPVTPTPSLEKLTYEGLLLIAAREELQADVSDFDVMSKLNLKEVTRVRDLMLKYEMIEVKDGKLALTLRGEIHINIDSKIQDFLYSFYIADLVMKMDGSRRNPSPRGKDKVRTYYHGTDEKSGKEIIKSGYLLPASEVGFSYLTEVEGATPVSGMVYVTRELDTSLHFAQSSMIGKYGYIFEIDGRNLVDIYPDEDEVGDMIRAKEPLWIHDKAKKILKKIKKVPKGSFVDIETFDEDTGKMKKWSSDEYTQNLIDEYGGNLYDALMKIEILELKSLSGKIMINSLSNNELISLIDYGKNIANKSKLKVSRAWKFKLGSSIKASNFFDFAEEIKIGREKGKGDGVMSTLLASSCFIDDFYRIFNTSDVKEGGRKTPYWSIVQSRLKIDRVESTITVRALLLKALLNWKRVKYTIQDIIKKYQKEEKSKKNFNKMLVEVRKRLSASLKDFASYYRLSSKKIAENALEKLLSFYQLSIKMMGKSLISWEENLDPLQNEKDLISYLGEIRFGDELRDLAFNPADYFNPWSGDSFHFGKSYNGQSPASKLFWKSYRGNPDDNERHFLNLRDSATLLGKLKVSDIISKKDGSPMTFVNLIHSTII